MPRLPERLLAAAVLLSVVLSGCGRDSHGPPVVVYTTRDPGLVQPAFDAYTAATGTTVILTALDDASVVARLGEEKHGSTADLVLVDGIGHLWSAGDNDLLRPGHSKRLTSNTPSQLQDPEDVWFALLTFGKAIAYDERVIERGDLTSYLALGEERFHGRLCLSSAADVDEQALVAMMIAEHGERPAELIVRSWIRNLAAPIAKDDARLLAAIDDGQCGAGIVSSNEALRYLRERPESRVAISRPPAASGGTYIDVVAAAVTRHAGNPAGAIELLEWLSSERGQQLLAAGGFEDRFGDQASDISPVNLAVAGYYLEDAVRLMERARWRR
jgi:iron(III) transport system substrate-binding protein